MERRRQRRPPGPTGPQRESREGGEGGDASHGFHAWLLKSKGRAARALCRIRCHKLSRRWVHPQPSSCPRSRTAPCRPKWPAGHRPSKRRTPCAAGLRRASSPGILLSAAVGQLFIAQQHVDRAVGDVDAGYGRRSHQGQWRRQQPPRASSGRWTGPRCRPRSGRRSAGRRLCPGPWT